MKHTGEIDCYVTAKGISGALATRLSQTKAEDRAVLEQILGQLHPSANMLRDLLRLADDICAREGISFSQLFGLTELHHVLCDQVSGQKDKLHKIKRLLEARRYPESHKIRQELDQCQRMLVRETGLKIELPKDLEGDTLHCTIAFRSAAECADIIDKLAALKSHPAYERILSLLTGREPFRAV